MNVSFLAFNLSSNKDVTYSTHSIFKNNYVSFSVPCTEADFKNGKFSEKYVTNTAMSAISSYMDMQQLEGRPELIGFEFVEPKY